MDIDLVYCWCTGAEAGYQARREKARKDLMMLEDKNRTDTRATDHNELRYSLRSVEKYAPWIHHIYIVTSKQVPEWLNLNHPKITVIDDSEIVPNEYLPTFNSNVIEAFLHKIPGLSEYFLYACDDMLFGKETGPDFFFNEKNRPIHYTKHVKKYDSIYWHRILKKAKNLAEKDLKQTFPKGAFIPCHNIDPYTKTLYANAVNHFGPHYQKMLPNKFRRENDIQRFLVSCWGVLKKQLVWKKPDPKCVDYFEKATENVQKKLTTDPPNLFCINDSDSMKGADYEKRAIFFQKLFPNKSEFEKDGNIVIPNYQDYGLKPAFPKNNIPVVLTVDEKFLPYCGVAITSLIQHVSSQYNYDIIVLNTAGNLTVLSDLMEPQLPANVSFRILNVSPYLKEYKETFMKGFPQEKVTKWTRTFIPEWLNHYEKVLYLDTDVLVKCDVAELWNMDLAGKAVGGVVDMAAHPLGNSREKLMHDIFHCDSIDDYINLGVMVMDLNALRQMNFKQKFLDLIASVPGNFWSMYDLFNALLHKNIKLLPMTYNYQNSLLAKRDNLYPFFEDEYYLAFQKARNEGPKIVHFSGIQPWIKMVGIESFYWWKVAKTTDFYEMILISPKLPPMPKVAERKKSS